jgi:3-phenylpropionate/trans-cinnamate dioxygenase ferredoxin reductase component
LVSRSDNEGFSNVEGIPRRIVIVGAGDCGIRTALRVRELGFEGDVTVIGDEVTAPYERPALSKSVLTNDDGLPATIASAAQLESVSIDWRSGIRASSIDTATRTVSVSDGMSLPYDRLLIATGARARRPAVPGAAELADAIHLVRSFEDVVALRQRLVRGARLLVIGGGFIGLEVAASAVERGCQVTVAEFAYRLMSRVVPTSIAQIVHDRHVANGVDIRCGAGLELLSMRGRAFRARLSDDSVVEADVLVAGTGAIPNTELASTAGLRLRNGVQVDQYLRTTDPTIFAAGDCCSVPHPLYDGRRVRLEAWRSATGQAKVAAANMLGAATVFDEVPWFWSDQYDLQLQVAGLHAEATIDVARNTANGGEIRFGLDDSGRIVSASGVASDVAVTRDLQTSRHMIAARAAPTLADLADPSVDLRDMLSVARQGPRPISLVGAEAGSLDPSALDD